MKAPTIRWAAVLAAALALATAAAGADGVTPEQARSTYARFVALDGVWRGRSTKGWEDSVVYRTVAAGSVVMQTSFEAHPGEMMVTMVHPDRDRLMLTHYCVAKNQPRLVLSEYAEGGARVTFAFLDGGNMASRDTGHMDRVVFRFAGPDTFTSHWTWYRDGKESWMEEIHYSRLASAAEAGPERDTPTLASERIVLESGDWRLVGDLVMPVASSPMPAVILLNRAAGDRRPYAELADQLARLGIASLRLDLRAHGESINRGRFVPSEGIAILEGSEKDVIAAHEYLRRDARVDPARIGFVGSSYSGEVMMQAARASRYGAAYVGLSPGSLSDESIAAIDSIPLPFLLVVARHERHLVEVAKAFREQSRMGEFLEVSGTEHATGLLTDHPDLAERLAVWFRSRLSGEPRLPVTTPSKR